MGRNPGGVAMMGVAAHVDVSVLGMAAQVAVQAAMGCGCWGQVSSSGAISGPMEAVGCCNDRHQI